MSLRVGVTSETRREQKGKIGDPRKQCQDSGQDVRDPDPHGAPLRIQSKPHHPVGPHEQKAHSPDTDTSDGDCWFWGQIRAGHQHSSYEGADR